MSFIARHIPFWRPFINQRLADGKPVTAIRLRRHGCANRPFYHIVVVQNRRRNDREGVFIEKIGHFDAVTNQHGERICAIDYSRLKYWIAQESTYLSDGVSELLGASGFLPIWPEMYEKARINREALRKEQEEDFKEKSPLQVDVT